MKDERYWYGVGWKQLIRRVTHTTWGCLPEFDPFEPGFKPVPDDNEKFTDWFEAKLAPALQKLPHSMGDALNSLLGEPDKLLAQLQRYERLRLSNLRSCMHNYLWGQRLVMHGGGTPYELALWEKMRKFIGSQPTDTDWRREENMRRLADAVGIARLETVEDYLSKFYLTELIPLDLDAGDVKDMPFLRGEFSDILLDQLRHCLEQFDQTEDRRRLLHALLRELGFDAPPLDVSRTTRSRLKEKAIQALSECMESVTTL